jgi:hypothetical protein
VRPSTINRVLIDQTCFGRSGGLDPISLPLFQGVRGRSVAPRREVCSIADWRASSQGLAALRKSSSTYVGSGSHAEELALSITGPLYPEQPT